MKFMILTCLEQQQTGGMCKIICYCRNEGKKNPNKQKNAPSKFKEQITTRTRNRKETDPEKCWRDDICDMHIRV